MTVNNEVTLQLTGQHTLSLRIGDLLHSGASLIVTTVYAHGSSELFSALQAKLGCQEAEERLLVPIEGGGHVSLRKLEEQAVLCVHIPYEEGTKQAKEHLEHMIQATFSAIAMLHFEGQTFSTIGLPMLGHKMIEQHSYEQILKLYLHYASLSLRYVDVPVQLTYYVLEAHYFEQWQSLLANITHSNVSQAGLEQAVEQQKRRLLEQVQALQHLSVPQLDGVEDALTKATFHTYAMRQIEALNMYLLQQVYEQALPQLVVTRPLSFPTKELLELELLPRWYWSYFTYMHTLKQTREPFQSFTAENKLLYLTMARRLLALFSIVQTNHFRGGLGNAT